LKRHVSPQSEYIEKESSSIMTKFRIRFYHFVQKIIPNKQYRRILDLGCGDTPVAVNLGVSNTDIVLCDIVRTRCTTIIADGRRLPFRDNSFDLTVSTEVLEHIDDQDSFLAEIKRVSKWFIVTTPNVTWARVLYRFLTKHDVTESHINEKNYEMVKKLFKKHFASFKIIGFSFPFPLLEKTYEIFPEEILNLFEFFGRCIPSIAPYLLIFNFSFSDENLGD